MCSRSDRRSLSSSLPRTFTAAWLEYRCGQQILKTKLESGSQITARQVRQRAANCKIDKVDKQTHRAQCSSSYSVATLGTRSSWSLQRVQSSQHDFILISAVPECSEKMYCGDRFIFGHPSSASPWNEVCVFRKPTAQERESGVVPYFSRSMSGTRPRGRR